MQIVLICRNFIICFNTYLRILWTFKFFFFFCFLNLVSILWLKRIKIRSLLDFRHLCMYGSVLLTHLTLNHIYTIFLLFFIFSYLLYGTSGIVMRLIITQYLTIAWPTIVDVQLYLLIIFSFYLLRIVWHTNVVTILPKWIILTSFNYNLWFSWPFTFT